MQIRYKSVKIKKICNDISSAKKKYDIRVAEKLIKTINFIENAYSLKDIISYIPFRFHDLKGDRKGTFAIDLGKKLGYRLIVIPIDSEDNPCSNEQVFSEKACGIKIISIEEVTNHYDE